MLGALLAKLASRRAILEQGQEVLGGEDADLAGKDAHQPRLLALRRLVRKREVELLAAERVDQERLAQLDAHGARLVVQVRHVPSQVGEADDVEDRVLQPARRVLLQCLEVLRADEHERERGLAERVRAAQQRQDQRAKLRFSGGLGQ